MKTKNNYPKNANRIKVILVAGMILMQVTLVAGKSSYAGHFTGTGTGAYSKNTELLNASNGRNENYTIPKEATEQEYDIEDWMCTVYQDFLNAGSDEEEIELEEWMYNPQDNFWKDIFDAEEPEIAIESWMENPQDWEIQDSPVKLANFTEAK